MKDEYDPIAAAKKLAVTIDEVWPGEMPERLGILLNHAVRHAGAKLSGRRLTNMFFREVMVASITEFTDYIIRNGPGFGPETAIQEMTKVFEESMRKAMDMWAIREARKQPN